jgi:hypothetical protein
MVYSPFRRRQNLPTRHHHRANNNTNNTINVYIYKSSIAAAALSILLLIKQRGRLRFFQTLSKEAPSRARDECFNP